MRLLHTTALQLTDFVGKAPPYAILSHTWGEEEVLFADVSNPDVPKAGWAKVRSSCDLARSLGHDWIWIDTCCIDKSSSAELSEAINSMFKFYEKATICLAYLSDVNYPVSKADIPNTLPKSRWFTRGWTLQELLAPKRLDFYSSDWKLLGSRREFQSLIAETTGIGWEYIGGYHWPKSVEAASVAERMSWASRRRTTRLEDTAYCLLGIFGLNMPLIYGEGAKAFERLQRAIIHEMDDQSIFAWGNRHIPMWTLGNRSSPLLARSPSWFEDSEDIVPFQTEDMSTPLIHAGSRITIPTPLLQGTPKARQSPRHPFPLTPVSISDFARPDVEVLLAPLKCRRKHDLFNCVAIPLCKVLQNSALKDSLSCYRLSHAVATAPRSLWISENICKPMVYIQSTFERGEDYEQDDRACVIRTLPRGYTIRGRRRFDSREYDSCLEIVKPDILLRYKKDGKGYPIILTLEGKSLPDLALVLRFLFDSKQYNTVAGVEARVLYYTPFSPLNRQDCDHILDSQSTNPMATDIRGIRVCDTLTVNITKSAAYGLSSWVLDISDPQETNRSMETNALTGRFEPVRSQVFRGNSGADRRSIETQSLSSRSCSPVLSISEAQTEDESQEDFQCQTPTSDETQCSW
ncbi:HET domain-containing protein [Colletotrichum camelliae]|nr:HET domain-containing protein [Colletotrichum camelliae]